MSDLKLTNSGVIAEGEYFAIHAASFELKDSARSDASRGRGHQRKALVHEIDDRLVINHSNDYKGVTLNSDESELKVNGKSVFSKEPLVPDLLLTDPKLVKPFLPRIASELVNEIPPGLSTTNIPGVSSSNSSGERPQARASLTTLLKEMIYEILSLKEQVNELKERVNS